MPKTSYRGDRFLEWPTAALLVMALGILSCVGKAASSDDGGVDSDWARDPSYEARKNREILEMGVASPRRYALNRVIGRCRLSGDAPYRFHVSNVFEESVAVEVFEAMENDARRWASDARVQSLQFRCAETSGEIQIEAAFFSSSQRRLDKKIAMAGESARQPDCLSLAAAFEELRESVGQTFVSFPYRPRRGRC